MQCPALFGADIHANQTQLYERVRASDHIKNHLSLGGHGWINSNVWCPRLLLAITTCKYSCIGNWLVQHQHC